MKFYFCASGPDQKHRDGTFTRHISAVTLEDPKEPGRPAFLQLAIKMTYANQSVGVIKKAIEEKVGHEIELAGGYNFEATPKGFNPENYYRGSAMDAANPEVKPGIPVVVMETLTTKKGKKIQPGTKGTIVKLIYPESTHSLDLRVRLDEGGIVEDSATQFGYPKETN